MNRNRKTESNNKKANGKRNYRRNSHNQGRSPKEKYNGDDMKLDATGRDNNPNWYFLDAGVADQVSQLSFQQLAGYNITLGTDTVKVPNIVVEYFNPCPGVQLSGTYSSVADLRKSAINLSGFRTYSKLAAYTGRQAIYGPQDVSTMILAMGELISTIEWTRRAFGVAYTMNMRNRAYPQAVIEAMGIDANDLMANLANYRTQFNAIITRVNQLPIPKDIYYFDKCAEMYEKLYLDSPSSMAQTIIPSIATTWLLDETSFSGGTILATEDWGIQATTGQGYNSTALSWFLGKINVMIDRLMNSSTLQIVYTDLLNLATKMKTEFWKFDYLTDFYAVFPEFNQNFSLQFHNTTFTGCPYIEQSNSNLSSFGVTPLNDVYPNAADNALYYNPAFPNILVSGSLVAGSLPRTGTSVIVDMIDENVTVVDRVEVTRHLAISGTTGYIPTGETTNVAKIDAVLPDHYSVCLRVFCTDNTIYMIDSSIETSLQNTCMLATTIDWSPRFYQTGNGSGLSGNRQYGDLNFYTVVDSDYLRRLHDFVGLGLYDLR